MNKVMLSGRLGQTPEDIAGGAKFNMATKDYNGENETTLWTRVVVFGKQADLCKQYLTKGSLVLITGRLNNQKKEDGTIRTSVIADHVEFVLKNDVSEQG